MVVYVRINTKRIEKRARCSVSNGGRLFPNVAKKNDKVVRELDSQVLNAKGPFKES